VDKRILLFSVMAAALLVGCVQQGTPMSSPTPTIEPLSNFAWSAQVACNDPRGERGGYDVETVSIVGAPGYGTNEAIEFHKFKTWTGICTFSMPTNIPRAVKVCGMIAMQANNRRNATGERVGAFGEQDILGIQKTCFDVQPGQTRTETVTIIDNKPYYYTDLGVVVNDKTVEEINP